MLQTISVYKPVILTNDMVSDIEQGEVHSQSSKGIQVGCLKCQIKHTSKILAHLKGTKCVFCSNMLTVFIHPVFIDAICTVQLYIGDWHMAS